MINLIFLRLVEQGINFVLTLDSSKAFFLEKFNGKVVKLEISEGRVSFFLIIRNDRIYVYQNFSDQPDTVIRGSFFSFFRQLLPTTPVTTLEIEGDAELAHQLKILLQEINIDWEEYLSYLTGDVVAKQFNIFWSNLQRTTVQISKRTLEDLLDYIHEEKRLLPTRTEVEDFYDELLELRQNIERLEARFDRLRISAT